MLPVKNEEPFTANVDPLALDVVPIPTSPVFVTVKVLVVASVDEPIAKAGPVIPVGLMESFAYGEVEPIPTFPLEARKSDEVPMRELVPSKYAT
jgi:hypothetical protein